MLKSLHEKRVCRSRKQSYIYKASSTSTNQMYEKRFHNHDHGVIVIGEGNKCQWKCKPWRCICEPNKSYITFFVYFKVIEPILALFVWLFLNKSAVGHIANGPYELLPKNCVLIHIYVLLFIKVDKQLASGEYFLKEKERRLKAQEEKKVLSNTSFSIFW